MELVLELTIDGPKKYVCAFLDIEREDVSNIIGVDVSNISDEEIIKRLTKAFSSIHMEVVNIK